MQWPTGLDFFDFENGLLPLLLAFLFPRTPEPTSKVCLDLAIGGGIAAATTADDAGATATGPRGTAAAAAGPRGAAAEAAGPRGTAAEAAGPRGAAAKAAGPRGTASDDIHIIYIGLNLCLMLYNMLLKFNSNAAEWLWKKYMSNF